MYKNFTVTKESGIVTLAFHTEGKSVNCFNEATLLELDSATQNLAKDNDVKGLIITSQNPNSFIVGADITEFVKLFDVTSEKVAEVVKLGQTIFNRIEDYPFPTVAAISGDALGGGLEIALACDFRIVNDVECKLGLPETRLGIIPAWGGTTRLPRLVGAQKAIEMICGGKTLRPKEALKVGLVNAVTSKVIDGALQILNTGDWKKARDPKLKALKINFIESMMVFKLAEGQVGKEAGPHYPAPLRALGIIRDAKKMDRDEALEFEVGAFVELFATPVARNLIRLFLSEQTVKASNRKWSKDTPAPKKVAILGCGTMGRGIATLTANKGIPVVVYDKDENALKKCVEEAKAYQMKKVGKGYITVEDMAAVMDRLQTTTVIESIAEADLVIEAIYEDWDAKSSIFATVDNLEPINGKNKAVIGTNTSSFSVNKLSKQVRNPASFCGIHFFNPPNKMPLVEIVRGNKTDDATISKAVAYAMAIGQTPVVVKDCPGFLVNRLLFPYMLAFDSLVASGVDFQQIDKTMQNWGWPMGPATLSDLVGIDVVYHAATQMASAYPDRLNFDQESSPTAKLYRQGFLGQKSGKGWYEYKDSKKVKANYTSGSELASKEIVAKLMKPMVQEAVKVMEEGIVDSWESIRIALVMGCGFPPYRGGLDNLNME